MSLITSTDPSVTPERVLNGEFPGIFLNPSAPCVEEEFFGVFGTKEQYEKFYMNQREAQISKRALKEIPAGVSVHTYREMRDQIEEEYKDWWECKC